MDKTFVIPKSGEGGYPGMEIQAGTYQFKVGTSPANMLELSLERATSKNGVVRLLVRAQVSQVVPVERQGCCDVDTVNEKSMITVHTVVTIPKAVAVGIFSTNATVQSAARESLATAVAVGLSTIFSTLGTSLPSLRSDGETAIGYSPAGTIPYAYLDGNNTVQDGSESPFAFVHPDLGSLKSRLVSLLI